MSWLEEVKYQTEGLSYFLYSSSLSSLTSSSESIQLFLRCYRSSMVVLVNCFHSQSTRRTTETYEGIVSRWTPIDHNFQEGKHRFSPHCENGYAKTTLEIWQQKTHPINPIEITTLCAIIWVFSLKILMFPWGKI